MTDQERYHAARRDASLVVLEGFHALKHAVRFGARIVDIVTDQPHHLAELAQRLAPDVATVIATDIAGRARVMDTPSFEALSPAPHPTRVIALAARPAEDVAAVFNATAMAPIVVLDDPRHAGNVGAAIRVAAAADAAGLFVTGQSDPWHPASVRGAAGLQFALPVARIASLPSTQRAIIGVDADGDDMHRTNIPRDAVLVFGSERDGITDAMRSRITHYVRIPMRTGVSSLNLATAVAIMLYRDLSRDSLGGT
jgi:TrmH family RNA methyltransferase